MIAKVVNRFKAEEHGGHVYQPGDVYPAEGFEANAERVAYLSEVHPNYGVMFLVVTQGEDASGGEEFPKHAGGGTYELSNGEKVKGKKEAIEAEKALKSDANVDHT
ncbi:hypothetical protein M5X00_30925 [Paenibacillus alvei]|uniref:hypothetical protein n=1 Tax=Paenibacillus alvei TaxID=44250 RepID=UPI00227E6C78|nr:hypothetical protein [Paenibacillus alvei]MCY9544439.1 hypothetical protein [Paenibacillus alvei]MCY9708018.1 hypothetical protein [Paenibacillus alvei]MCY9738310.1 hypothetical protein [Paenibacillus alvei]MCY9758636.1 hypothetical protein [Paenibacillus alvei]MEC0083055.1 hypothetical protein [Paenibacillus alvei]